MKNEYLMVDVNVVDIVVNSLENLARFEASIQGHIVDAWARK